MRYVLCAIFCGLSMAQAQSFSQSEFILGTFWDPDVLPGNNIASDEQHLATLKSANFNLLMGEGDFAKTRAGNLYRLDRLATVTGLKTLIHDDGYGGSAAGLTYNQAAADAILAKYDASGTDALTSAQRGVLYGYNLADEPKPAVIANTLLWQNRFQSVDVSKLAYVNLNPYVKNVTPDQVGYWDDWNGYKTYVHNWISNSQVKVAGFDYYTVLDAAGGTFQTYGETVTYYFRNLELFAKETTPLAKSFWAYPLSVKHGGLDKTGACVPGYAAITEPNLRFSAWAPIAYGAKGLIYFTYAKPNASCYDNALIDDAYNTQASYTWAKNINAQVKSMGSTLMNLTWKTTVHGSTNDAFTTEPVPKVGAATPYLKSISSDRFMVGIFDGKNALAGVPHLLVMNKERTNTTINAVTLGIQGNYIVERHPKNSGSWVLVNNASFDNRTGITTVPVGVTNGGAELLRLKPNPLHFGGWNGAAEPGWGGAESRPFPADYDGDGKADRAVFSDAGVWKIKYSSTGSFLTLPGYGDAAALPTPADYDGDKKANLSIYYPPQHKWYIDYASNGYCCWQSTVAINAIGGAGEKPVPADYDNDGKADIGIFAVDGKWYLDLASNGFGTWDQVFSTFTSFASAKPLAFDFDGDKHTDLAVYTAAGEWIIDYFSDGLGATPKTFRPGLVSAATAVPADFDGDGRADLSIKTSTGNGGWYIDLASDGFGKWNQYYDWYGDAGAKPVPADYDGDKKADLSIKDDATGNWFLDNANQ
ncbi:MAG: repeat protein [Fibrobacteres bacterium]|nr:repeat protein [Fibrobacterota bacterium]